MTDLPLLIGVGGVIVFAAAFAGGATGFGENLLSTPLLLLIGFPAAVVVTANLALACLTRTVLGWRLRRDASLRPAAYLSVASVPGALGGLWVLEHVDAALVKRFVGVVVVASAVGLAAKAQRGLGAPTPPGCMAAGVVGGVLGTSTSLSGVPPTLMLTRTGITRRSFIGVMAIYFVISSACALVLMAALGLLVPLGIAIAAMWGPGAMLGNAIGLTAAAGLPEAQFRRLVLVLVCCSGVVAVLAA